METKLDMLIHQQDSEESEMLETEIKTGKERKREMTHEEMNAAEVFVCLAAKTSAKEIGEDEIRRLNA